MRGAAETLLVILVRSHGLGQNLPLLQVPVKLAELSSLHSHVPLVPPVGELDVVNYDVAGDSLGDCRADDLHCGSRVEEVRLGLDENI